MLVELLQQEAVAALAAHDPGAAKAKIDRALKLNPNDVRSAEIAGVVSEHLREIVSGRWSLSGSTDPMTDERTTVVQLPSIVEPGAEVRPAVLVARCKSRKLELYVGTETTLDSGLYGDVSARLRLDEAPAQSLRGSRSASGEAFFFGDGARWLNTFIKQPTSTMLLELPTHSGRLLLRFELTGADVAIAKVVEACGGFPKPKKQHTCWNETDPKAPVLISCPCFDPAPACVEREKGG